MAGPADLGALQAWMSEVIRHKADARTAVRGRPARKLVPPGAVARGEVVLPGGRMTPVERLQVYNGGYFTRLEEVLQADYKVLLHAMGAPAFSRLALDYVARHPSRHPNLNRFGKRLPEFIGTRKELPDRAFLRDLARLERAMAGAFDAPASEPADIAALAHLTQQEWSGATFTLNPSVSVLRFLYPVNAYLQAVLDAQDPAIPGRGASRVAVYRKDDRVWRSNLPAPVYRILRALGAGETFGQALARGGRHRLDVAGWFRDWSADGLFSRIEVPG